MWKSAVPTTMQGFGDYCNQMQTNQTITLTDTRDNNRYAVAKIWDGKCWMTEALRIQDYNATSQDSDINNGTFLILKNGSSGGFNYNGGSSNNNYVFIGTNGNNIVGLYTWFLATAGTGTSSMRSGEATSSICPKGWKLPVNDMFSKLQTGYNGSVFNPKNQECCNGSVSCGSQCYFWTSTAYSDGVRAGNIYTSGASINFCAGCVTTGQKDGGQAVRCYHV